MTLRSHMDTLRWASWHFICVQFPNRNRTKPSQLWARSMRPLRLPHLCLLAQTLVDTLFSNRLGRPVLGYASHPRSALNNEQAGSEKIRERATCVRRTKQHQGSALGAHGARPHIHPAVTVRIDFNIGSQDWHSVSKVGLHVFIDCPRP